MIVILVGASGTGKDSVATELIHRYGFKCIVSYTTRLPRENEQNGVSYFFIDGMQFDAMQKQGDFAETDRYSGDRYYGSRTIDYKIDGNVVKILTPNGIRQLLKKIPREECYIVYLYSPLEVKCQRYIAREKNSFDIEKLIELTRRSIADTEMFRWMAEEADLCIENDDTITIEEIANLIVTELAEWEV